MRYNRFTRAGSQWAKTECQRYIGMPCFNIARDIQAKKYPDNARLKEVFSEEDEADIMRIAQSLYDYASRIAAAELEHAKD